jgi:uncharacterized protein (TIGR02246 family)
MTAGSKSDARQAIEAANRNLTASLARGDAAGMATLYTANGQLLPPNSDVASGTQAIQAFWQAVIGMGIKEATLQTGEVEAHGDTAFEVGRFTLKGEGGHVLDQGKYIVIWKQEGGQWKLHRDIWNSSQPAG